MHNRRSAAVGTGPCVEVVSLRDGRRRPCKVHAAMAGQNAVAKEGSSASHSSTVRLVKSHTSVVWVGMSRYGIMICVSFYGRHSVTQIVINSNFHVAVGLRLEFALASACRPTYPA